MFQLLSKIGLSLRNLRAVHRIRLSGGEAIKYFACLFNLCFIAIRNDKVAPSLDNFLVLEDVFF